MLTQSMVQYGNVTLNGKPVGEGAYVGAFADNECRGQGKVAVNENVSYTTLVVNSEKPEEITYRLYIDGNTYDLNKTISVVPGKISRNVIDLAFMDMGAGPTVTVAPNPAGEVLRIICLVPEPSRVDIEIFDMVGKKVYGYSENILAGSHSVELKDLKGGHGITPGLYILKVSNSNKVISKKVVIQ